mmetsp:Transcript_84484/g.182072  ORF Transcript_84484/g.182072 Transcript_84484/m.182072 type:complete len:603 (-) Transcript_84484:71-1879(-)
MLGVLGHGHAAVVGIGLLFLVLCVVPHTGNGGGHQDETHCKEGVELHLASNGVVCLAFRSFGSDWTHCRRGVNISSTGVIRDSIRHIGSNEENILMDIHSVAKGIIRRGVVGKELELLQPGGTRTSKDVRGSIRGATVAVVSLELLAVGGRVRTAVLSILRAVSASILTGGTSALQSAVMFLVFLLTLLAPSTNHSCVLVDTHTPTKLVLSHTIVSHHARLKVPSPGIVLGIDVGSSRVVPVSISIVSSNNNASLINSNRVTKLVVGVSSSRDVRAKPRSELSLLLPGSPVDEDIGSTGISAHFLISSGSDDNNALVHGKGTAKVVLFLSVTGSKLGHHQPRVVILIVVKHVRSTSSSTTMIVTSSTNHCRGIVHSNGTSEVVVIVLITHRESGGLRPHARGAEAGEDKGSALFFVALRMLVRAYNNGIVPHSGGVTKLTILRVMLVHVVFALIAFLVALLFPLLQVKLLDKSPGGGSVIVVRVGSGVGLVDVNSTRFLAEITSTVCPNNRSSMVNMGVGTKHVHFSSIRGINLGNNGVGKIDGINKGRLGSSRTVGRSRSGNRSRMTMIIARFAMVFSVPFIPSVVGLLVLRLPLSKRILC